MSRLAALLVLVALVASLAPGAAAAAQPRFSMSEIEAELMCPTCQTRLDMSHSPAADRIRAYVEDKRSLGWSKEQVKDALVAQFGPSVLAAPPAEGIGLVAWLVPLGALAVGAVAAAGLAVFWRRRRWAPPAAAGADLDARVDEALRDLADDG